MIRYIYSISVLLLLGFGFAMAQTPAPSAPASPLAPVEEEVVEHKKLHYNHHHPIHLRDHHEKLSVDVMDLGEERYIELVVKTHTDIGCLPAKKTSLAVRLENGNLVELSLDKKKCGKLVEHPIFGKHNYVIVYKLTEGQVNQLREAKIRNITLYGPGGKIYHDVTESPYGLEEQAKTYFIDNLL